MLFCCPITNSTELQELDDARVKKLAQQAAHLEENIEAMQLASKENDGVLERALADFQSVQKVLQ